jgi:hypothetical protein
VIWPSGLLVAVFFTVCNSVKVKVKFSHYRPYQALGDPEVKAPDFHDFRHYEGGKVVTLTHRPPLPPGVLLVLIFRGL